MPSGELLRRGDLLKCAEHDRLNEAGKPYRPFPIVTTYFCDKARQIW
jgi:hypothetical protein